MNPILLKGLFRESPLESFVEKQKSSDYNLFGVHILANLTAMNHLKYDLVEENIKLLQLAKFLY